ncbi:unnamed protein product [Discosporangium mesarthrocarpum]
MNSLLQQLYHVPSFSEPLLGLSPKSRTLPLPQGEAQHKAGKEDEVLFQLQVLFASLRISQRQYYDTRPFCSVFMDYDGQPIRLREQKDVNEFCTQLFDKLEGTSAGVGPLIKQVFGGSLVYQIISRDCEHTSERTEPFLVLTAEVQAKATLEESLQLYVAGEMLTGDNRYLCEKCGERVTAQRRCAIKTLPPTLIIHLKRFDFDLETMTRRKLNHRCSFPMELDMEPWTIEGINRQEHNSIMRGDSMVSMDQRRDLSTPGVNIPDGLEGITCGALGPSGKTTPIATGSRADEKLRLGKTPDLEHGQSIGTEGTEWDKREDTGMVGPLAHPLVSSDTGIERMGGNIVRKSSSDGGSVEASSNVAQANSEASPNPEGKDLHEGNHHPLQLMTPESAPDCAAEGQTGLRRSTDDGLEDEDTDTKAGNGVSSRHGATRKTSAQKQMPGIDSNYYKYRLKGVVAHQGTADSGHYYSLVRVGRDQWVELNDHIVQPFDPARIPSECFGGKTEPSSKGKEAGAQPHQPNAYLLVYESYERAAVAPPANSISQRVAHDTASQPPQHPPLVTFEAEGGADAAESNEIPHRGPSSLVENKCGIKTADTAASVQEETKSSGCVERGIQGTVESRVEALGEAPSGSTRGQDVFNQPSEKGREASSSAEGSSLGRGGGLGDRKGQGSAALQVESLAPPPSHRRLYSDGSTDWGSFYDRAIPEDDEVFMTPDVLHEVWSVNMSFLREMYLLDTDFFRLVWGLLQQPHATQDPAMAALAVHAGIKVCVEMVARARASTCVPLWCRRLSEICLSHGHATQNALTTLATGRRENSKAGYLKDMIVSCPHATTRKAFVILICDALKATETRNSEASMLVRSLLGLLEERGEGVASASSPPGGLAHIASALAAAVGARDASSGAASLARQAVVQLLDCLSARQASLEAVRVEAMVEATRPVVGAVTAAARQQALARRPPPPSKIPFRLQDVDDFPCVVKALGGLIATVVAEGGEGVMGGGCTGVDVETMEAVIKRDFLAAAITACPREAAEMLAQLVWRDSSTRRVACSRMAGAVGNREGSKPAVGEVWGTPEGQGGGDDEEIVLELVVGIVLEAAKSGAANAARDVPGGKGGRSQSASPPPPPAGAAAGGAGATTAPGETEEIAVIRGGMFVLSRLLHLQDGGTQSRVNVVLGKLMNQAAAVSARTATRSKDRGLSVTKGVGVEELFTYLLAKLVVSLYVHMPQVRRQLDEQGIEKMLKVTRTRSQEQQQQQQLQQQQQQATVRGTGRKGLVR